MKKIALTSLLAVAVAGAAHAANTMDGNPLYQPAKGHFYSVTDLGSHSLETDVVSLGEEFGYGITDRLAAQISTSVSEMDWFEAGSWNDVSVALDYRILGETSWKLDVYGEYGVAPIWPDHRPFMAKEDTMYGWTLGVRGGYVTEDWTLAAHVGFTYLNSESFNWGNDEDLFSMNHLINFGVAGHWTMSDRWSAVASADYFKFMDRYNEIGNEGWWELELGLNMNIDDTKYVGAYIEKDVAHIAEGQWELVDGFGFGVKFGIDF